MKKLLYLLLISILFTSCEKDNNDPAKDKTLYHLTEGLQYWDEAVFQMSAEIAYYQKNDPATGTPSSVAVVLAGDGTPVTYNVTIDKMGLPDQVVINDIRIILGNYNKNTFDAVVIDKNDTTLVSEIPTNSDFSNLFITAGNKAKSEILTGSVSINTTFDIIDALNNGPVGSIISELAAQHKYLALLPEITAFLDMVNFARDTDGMTALQMAEYLQNNNIKTIIDNWAKELAQADLKNRDQHEYMMQKLNLQIISVNSLNVSKYYADISLKYSINTREELSEPVSLQIGIVYSGIFSELLTIENAPHPGKQIDITEPEFNNTFFDNYMLSGLIANTTYYFREYIKIGGQIKYGPIQSFTTKSDNPDEEDKPFNIVGTWAYTTPSFPDAVPGDFYLRDLGATITFDASGNYSYTIRTRPFPTNGFGTWEYDRQSSNVIINMNFAYNFDVNGIPGGATWGTARITTDKKQGAVGNARFTEERYGMVFTRSADRAVITENPIYKDGNMAYIIGFDGRATAGFSIDQ